MVTPTHVYESLKAAGVFAVEKRRVFFEKARFRVPKPCLLRFRLAAGTFLLKNDMPFEKVCFGRTDFFGEYVVNIGKCLYVPAYDYYIIIQCYYPYMKSGKKPSSVFAASSVLIAQLFQPRQTI